MSRRRACRRRRSRTRAGRSSPRLSAEGHRVASTSRHARGTRQGSWLTLDYRECLSRHCAWARWRKPSSGRHGPASRALQTTGDPDFGSPAEVIQCVQRTQAISPRILWWTSTVDDLFAYQPAPLAKACWAGASCRWLASQRDPGVECRPHRRQDRRPDPRTCRPSRASSGHGRRPALTVSDSPATSD